MEYRCCKCGFQTEDVKCRSEECEHVFVEIPAPCPSCAAKDAELSRLLSLESRLTEEEWKAWEVGVEYARQRKWAGGFNEAILSAHREIVALRGVAEAGKSLRDAYRYGANDEEILSCEETFDAAIAKRKGGK